MGLKSIVFPIFHLNLTPSISFLKKKIHELQQRIQHIWNGIEKFFIQSKASSKKNIILDPIIKTVPSPIALIEDKTITKESKNTHSTSAQTAQKTSSKTDSKKSRLSMLYASESKKELDEFFNFDQSISMVSFGKKHREVFEVWIEKKELLRQFKNSLKIKNDQFTPLLNLCYLVCIPRQKPRAEDLSFFASAMFRAVILLIDSNDKVKQIITKKNSDSNLIKNELAEFTQNKISELKSLIHKIIPNFHQTIADVLKTSKEYDELEKTIDESIKNSLELAQHPSFPPKMKNEVLNFLQNKDRVLNAIRDTIAYFNDFKIRVRLDHPLHKAFIKNIAEKSIRYRCKNIENRTMITLQFLEQCDKENFEKLQETIRHKLE